MAVATGTALALGGGALLGGIAGSQGKSTNQTTTFGAPSEREQDLQESAFRQYLKQKALADEQQAAIAGGQNTQDIARQSLAGVLSGGSFSANQEQQSQINAIRDAMIQSGQSDINNFIDQRLQQVNASAAQRGVRGQALSSLQTGAMNEGTRQYANLVGQANLQAQQQMQEVPYRQAVAQGGLASQNANFMEQLRQNAIQNRQQLSNPALLNYYQRERMGSGTTTNNEPANLGSIMGGALGGAGQIAGGYGNLRRGGAFDE